MAVFEQEAAMSNSSILLEGTTNGVNHVMGDVCLYLPGVLMHWERPGKNILHHESRALPRTLRFISAIPTKAPITQHPAFRQALTMATFHISSSVSPQSAPSLKPDENVVSPPLTPLPLPLPLLLPKNPTLEEVAKLIDHDQAFENTSTSVAASQMRNALNNLADTVEDPTEKKVCSLYTKYSGPS
jgi:hypothetical protein